MAEGTLFSLASPLLSATASPSVRRAFGGWRAGEELDGIGRAIQSVQAVLLDAEKRREESAAVNAWIQRLLDVLYRADDLFDEVVTNDLIYKQRMKEGTIGRKVRLFFSKPNSMASSLTLIHRLKAVRKSLDEVFKDTADFYFVLRRHEEPITGIRKGVGTGWLTDQHIVVGRGRDIDSIVGFLLDEVDARRPVSTIAIVGIGGLGKTTVAQLAYNTAKVHKNFKRRWWSCVSNMFDSAEIIRSIFESIIGKSCHGLNMSQLESELQGIRESISMNEKFLLVIDGLELENDFIEHSLRSLLTTDNTRGNKVIVTTRSLAVARAVNADRIHHLEGLSEDSSWDLFKRIAFTREQYNDPSWNSLGRKIVKKCANVPLAIQTVASLLYTKSSKEEWKSILDLQPGVDDGSIMSVLKLSYDHLPSNLKLCFSYCSMFPKDYEIRKDDLIRLWAAQGYVNPKNDETYEEVGDARFRELLRRSFFQDEKEDEDGEAIYYKMHDLIHDLAQVVANQESIVLTEGLDQFHQPIRHISVCYKVDSSWDIPPSLLACARLRSLLFMCGGSLSPLVLEQVLTKFKLLRSLDLQHQNIEEVPSSIGMLLHLRYLDLSGNKFKNLPNSITNLLNLLTLNLSSCVQLEALPVKFRKLINLRHLNNKNCEGLRYMPPRFGELTCLQHLSYFKVSKVIGGVNSSRLDALGELKLRGKLQIMFDNDIDDWDEDECWQLPTTVQVLEICYYPGMRIPHWDQRRVDIPSLLPKLVRVHLSNSSTIKHLPPLRCLPYLKFLHLSSLNQLTYVEEEQDKYESGQCDRSAAGYSMLFFPCLEELELIELPRLTGWSRDVEAVTTSKFIAAEGHSSCRDPPDQMPSFSLLSTLRIEECPMLKSVPPSSCLRTLELQRIKEELIQHVLSTCSHSLETVVIRQCDSLDSFSGETLTSLRHLELSICNEVKNLHLPQHNVLEELVIQSCPQLKLWELKKGGVDWDSLINLRVLSLDKIPDAERLSICLQQRTALGKLQIKQIL